MGTFTVTRIDRFGVHVRTTIVTDVSLDMVPMRDGTRLCMVADFPLHVTTVKDAADVARALKDAGLKRSAVTRQDIGKR